MKKLKTTILKTSTNNGDQIFSTCRATLENDGICIIKTDTLYGLIACYTSEKALSKLKEVKRRPEDKAFLAVVATIDMLKHYSEEPIPEALLNELPAPLTMIIRNKDARRYKLETLALRYPEHQLLCSLSKALDSPLWAPSANRHEQSNLLNEKAILREFDGDVECIVLDGDVTENMPSTLLDLSTKPYTILREGHFTREKLQPILNYSFK